MVQNALDMIAGLPWYVFTCFAVVVLALIYLLARAMSEGREVSVWPPKVGPRIPNPASASDSPSTKSAPTVSIRRGSVPQIGLTARPIALLCVDGGTTYILMESHRTLVVGHATGVDISLEDFSLSSTHFKLSIEPKPGNDAKSRAYQVTISDLFSANGTYVNGEAIQRHILRDGDLIQAGGTRTVYKQVSPFI